MVIPAALRRNVTETWGEIGRRWLTELPALAASVIHDWELEPGTVFPLSFNWVISVNRADGSEAVLKLGLPHAGHLADEAAALDFFAGQGAVRLLARDADRGALLLERARPGIPISALVAHRDEEATGAFVDVLRRLHRTAPPDSPLSELAARSVSFTNHLRAYPDGGPIPRHLVERAGRLFDELCATATDRVILHGDLHHDNILRADREPWLAIDPHGVVGDPGYEVGALLYNPEPARHDDELLALVPSRIEQLADGLEMPGERVVAWGFVQGVLSEVWIAEGGGTSGSRALDVALKLLPRLS